jgi:hypothetical protein
MRRILAILILSLLLLPLLDCQSSDSPTIVINEIAWMGTENSYNDEWIELYNNTSEDVDLDGWSLKANDGTPNITLTGRILAKGFFILERTDDDTLPDILADQIYKGTLGNDGENLELLDNLGNSIDSIDCSSGWFTGDNKTKQTMERKDSKLLGSDLQNWQTSENPSGTAKAKNSKQGIVNGKQSTQEENSSPSVQSEGTLVTYPSDIFINEILPSPDGPDAENEWIEIFNQNNSGVDISNWEIEDKEGKTKTYTLPENTQIPAKGFLVLKRSDTKIILNNAGDEVLLSQPDGKTIDKVSYENAPHNQSYSLINREWVWNNNLTPGFENTILNPVLEPEKEDKVEEIQTSIEERGIAAISNQSSEDVLSSLPALPALAIAISSAIIILILKRKTKRSVLNG